MKRNKDNVLITETMAHNKKEHQLHSCFKFIEHLNYVNEKKLNSSIKLSHTFFAHPGICPQVWRFRGDQIQFP